MAKVQTQKKWNRVAIQTTVEMKQDDHNFWMKHDISRLTRTYVRIDEITRRREVNVYTDDGKGNGDHLFTFYLD